MTALSTDAAKAAADLESQAQIEAGEKQPLLAEAGTGPPLSHRGATLDLDGVEQVARRQAKNETHAHGLVHRDEVKDAMTYHTQDLSDWNSMYQVSYTVWNRRSLWSVFFRLMALSLFVALLVLIFVRNPDQMHLGKFDHIAKFLSGFVGLLLGFFMSTSVNRWWSCAENFHRLCAAIRAIHIGLNSCGVPDEEMKHCLRYGVISAWILHMQLHVEAQCESKKEEALRAGWEAIRTGEGKDEDFGHVTAEELEILKGVSDPPGALWMWIGSMLGHFADEGLVPPLASPTYGRLMNIGLEGFNAIRSVRCSISVQAPFIYVQMLSSLVHINNIFNALSFGLQWGASLGGMLVHCGIPYWSEHKDPPGADSDKALGETQSLLVSFFFSCFGPFVYQALLEVSIAIAQPFSNMDAVVPTARIIHLLERDLHDGLRMAKQVPWKQPCFKKK